MKEIALRIHPDQVTLVPERREELTTEGGLDVKGNLEKIRVLVEEFKLNGISVSLFIDSDSVQIDASKSTGADSIEIHTGEYANAQGEDSKRKELKKIKDSANYAHSVGLRVFAGHGLNYQNVKEIVELPSFFYLFFYLQQYLFKYLIVTHARYNIYPF